MTSQLATVTTESLSDKEYEALSHVQTSVQYCARTGTNEMVQSQQAWPTLPDSGKCQNPDKHNIVQLWQSVLLHYRMKHNTWAQRHKIDVTVAAVLSCCV